MTQHPNIFRFWLPLEVTWLIMALEGPVVAAVIARMATPTFNLAAYGVALAIAMSIEAPIIMIMSAANALIKDRISFIKMRRFTYTLNTALTITVMLAITPAVFRCLGTTLLHLQPAVAELTHRALAFFLPWPAAIGYRRLYQGLLISHNQTKRVAYSTVVRIAAMTVLALTLFFCTHLSGAYVGAMALSFGVVMEAITCRCMCRHIVAAYLAPTPAVQPAAPPLRYRHIFHFYIPLAMTSVLAIGINPLFTFFNSISRYPIESLAVQPVILSVALIFRSFGLAYQETAIALLKRDNDFFLPRLRRFAAGIGILPMAVFACLAFSPLAYYFLHTVIGLEPKLALFAVLPLQIILTISLQEAWQCHDRARLIYHHRTVPITLASLTEVTTIVLVLAIAVFKLHSPGVVATAVALIVGKLGANIVLALASRQAR